jgi:primosomal protein N'
MSKKYYYQAIVKNFPSFSGQCFTYTSHETLPFGSRVLVPFGSIQQIRQGIVLGETSSFEQDSLSSSTDIPKDIHCVLTKEPQITHHHFSFFHLVSMYNLIPIHSLFLRAGLFAAQWNPQTLYQIHFDQLDKLQYFKQEKALRSFLQKHPQGFTPSAIQKALQIRKNSTVLKKMETVGIVDKIFQPPQTTLSETSSSVDAIETNPTVYLLNGLSPFLRMSFYKQYIHQHFHEKDVLIIVPNATSKKAYNTFFKKQPYVEIGTRDRIFEPKQRYSLIVIEDSTSPEYHLEVPFYIHIEKTTLMRHQELSEQIVFGSYLPSVFTYSELRRRNFQHISLPRQKDPENLIAPTIQFLDMKKEIVDHGYSLLPFSIQKKIQHTLASGEKVLLYMHRKGYYNLSICTHCGYVMKCPLCGVPLSYQPLTNKLTCRYCGQANPRKNACPECHHNTIALRSPGTSKIEEFAKTHFPAARILRIDRSLPTHSSEEVASSTLYIGTQKVFQEVDLKTVHLVVFVEIDSLLNTPSFSSQEKVLQSISHMYEHGFNKHHSQHIVIPTFAPKSELFRCIHKKTLQDYYETELQTRNQFGYPPFVDMMEISIHHKSQEIVIQKTQELREQIRAIDGIIIVSDKVLVGKSPHGIFQSSIIYRSENVIEFHQKIAPLLDALNKESGIRIYSRNLE